MRKFSNMFHFTFAITNFLIMSFSTVKLYLKGSTDGIPFPSNIDYPNGVNIRRFVSKYTGITYRTAAGVPGFDRIAIKFVKAKTDEERKEILKEAMEAADAFDETENDLKLRAQEYVKVMKKVIEKGPTFISTEIGRLRGLLTNTKISDAKKGNLTLKLNMVYHFDFDVDILLQQDAETMKNRKSEL
jgi:Endoplasmic reticulum protein ERp29, C-terminal domain